MYFNNIKVSYFPRHIIFIQTGSGFNTGVLMRALQLRNLRYTYPDDIHSAFNCHNVSRYTEFDVG
jgi:hypothetical protein